MNNKEELTAWTITYFNNLITEDEDKSVGLAAIETLMKLLELSQCETIQELRSHMLKAIKAMKSTNNPATSIASGSELFLRFITLTNLDNPSYEECKKLMMGRGQIFIEKLKGARQKIAEHAVRLIDSNHNIMTYAKSRVVLKTLKLAAEKKLHFHVYVVDTNDNGGEEMYNDLKQLNIRCSLIQYEDIGSIIKNINYVMIGAEGVCHSGGIINKSGTLSIAIYAHEMRKEFYVLAESFKFTTMCPFDDIPDEYKYTRSMMESGIAKDNPLVEYIPLTYVRLIFADTGIFTAEAAVDHILQLYV